MWTRENTLESLVHIILEQQVSLAAALAALHKLKGKLRHITAENLLSLDDTEMRACYVSRQKMVYLRELSHAVITQRITLDQFPSLSDDEVRRQLLPLKGIGHWTIDVYLMFVLQRADVFPIGDLAAINALKRLKKLPPATTRDEVLVIAEKWKPFRTIATMMLWHFYLSTSKKTPV